MLSIINVSKYFGGLAALKDVSFSIEQGEILGLIGPNGSGKTTLFNCICGIEKVTSGEIIFNGQRIENKPPHKICHLGIGKTYQNVRPFSNMSVYDNVRAGYSFSGKKGLPTIENDIQEIINFVGLEGKEDLLAGGLPIGQAKKLEIGRAIASHPDLILLDEVAAGLNIAESQEVIHLIHEINQKGATVLVVEHVMPIIMSICDRIIVLAEGNKIAEGIPSEIGENPKVIESYLGKMALEEL